MAFIKSVIRHSSFVIRHSSFVIRHSSFVIRHSSFVIRHSSFVIRHSSFVIRHSSFVIRHLSFVIHPSSVFTLFLLFPLFLFSQNRIPDSVALQTVVIQATRADTKSPVPHTNLTAEKIARTYHARDVPYLLSGIPSLVESSDAGAGVGYTNLRIRGSDPTRVNVTINGIPLNDAESQGVFWVDLPDLAASAAEIQVQRGVGTSTNGAGAFGATVNLDLSRIEPDPFAVVSNSFGSFATRKHSAFFGTGLTGGKTAFSGRISQIRSDGYIDRAAADLNSFHLSGAYIDDLQSLQGHLLSGHEITYQAWNGVPAQFIDNEELRTYNTAGTEKPGEPYKDEVDDYTQRHLLLHYKRMFPYGLSMQLNGHYTRGYGFYEQYKAAQAYADYGLPDWESGDTTIAETDLVRRRRLDNHFYGGTFALRWNPPVNLPGMSGPPVLTLGGALSRYEGRHFGEVAWAEIAGSAPKDFVYYDNDADKLDANIFFQTEIGLSKGLMAFLDLQVRHVRYEFLGFDADLNNVTQTDALTFFNPKAGITYSFSKRWNVYGFFGTGSREPNRDDYTQTTPGNRPRPERLFDLEAGLKTGGTGWNAAINFFRMQYRDQLAPNGQINDVGAYIRTNIADSHRTGVEIEAAGKIGSRLTLTGNAALSRNKVREFTEFLDNWDSGGQERIEHRNTDLAFSPGATARGEGTFSVLNASGRHALSFTLSGKYVDRQFLDNTSNTNTSLPGFFFADFRLNYDLEGVVGKALNLVFSVNNLFDRHFSSNGWAYRFISEGYDPRPDDPYSRREGGNIYNLTGFFPQAGRHWMATANLRF